MASYIRSDLEFILEQILIAEAHAAGADLSTLIPNSFLPLGLRTVDGSFNNLVPGQSHFGAADENFLRLLDPNFINENDEAAFAGVTNTDYAKLNAAGTATVSVVDSDPRIISNLIADQTGRNPVIYEMAFDAGADGNLDYFASFGADGLFGTADDGLGADGVLGGGDDTGVDVLKEGVKLVNGFRMDGTPFQTFEFTNTTPDEGLSAPFNSWFTLFGQFFDHGLDLVNKGGHGTVFIPLAVDDPLYVVGGPNFMMMSRATNTAIHAGADGIFGTSDDVHFQNNQTTPFVDQNQTYTSHPSHQVFLREYILVGGLPVATGHLLDGAHGGMPTWADVKNQARDILGIALDDQDLLNLPLVATDPYGKFIPNPNAGPNFGFPQLVVPPSPANPSGLVSGNPGAPVDATQAIRTHHAFLDDIAHTANPSGKTADNDAALGLSDTVTTAGKYDNELLDRHFITGDGRGNENIGLTAVHTVFHNEHNRLVEHTKQVILATGDPAFIAQWLVPGANQADGVQAAEWNGERLFQAARFGTEMQYQHLVFEEFARKVQPNVDPFAAPIGYDAAINPAIVAEFAHVVYRFGHSMLNETVDRYDANFNVIGAGGSTAAGAEQIGLIQAFLNPLEFVASGVDAAHAVGAIVRGMTRQGGNEIDEFVTEALRNNLVGLPLDLAAINIARGRDTGVPTLNQARAEFYAMTADSQLKPYESWADFAAHLRHQASIVNFIAAYGNHASITGATTMADKRAAAMLLVFGGPGEPADRLDFLNAAGAYAAGQPLALGGLNAVDFWMGGLAEMQMPFGGLLGSSFNFVFETQMENLQNADRFYYLSRTAGLNFGNELEQNSFAKLVMLNSDVTHLPADIFSTPTWTLEVDPTKQFTGLGATGRDDPTEGGTALIPLVIRDNPATPGADTNYLRYTGIDHVVLGGTAGNDIIVGSIGDDTLYGDAGNDRLEGGDGVDHVFGGDGDDIMTDLGGDDVMKGGAGNDVIAGGNGFNLIMGEDGSDFIITGEDETQTIAGRGNDFILGNKINIQTTGNEGDDWIEIGTQDGAVGDNFDPRGLDTIRGNDVFVGGGGFDEFISEGGDDIMFGSDGQEKMDGASGFDWATYIQATSGVRADLMNSAFNRAGATPSTFGLNDLFAFVEGLSGSQFADHLRGDNQTNAEILNAGAQGSVLDQAGINLISGLQALLGSGVTSFGGGNILLGGDGSDVIEGRFGNDIIDGDKYLNVRISVRANIDGTGAELRSVKSLTELMPDMLSGAINPGQLVIVREILDLPATAPTDFDTVVFSGQRANYTVVTANDGTTIVTDNVGNILGNDGTDTLRNIERLQFADQTILVVDQTVPVALRTANAGPVGNVTINDTTPSLNQVLTANANAVTDANGIVAGSMSFTWQFERVPGSGIFEDVVSLGGLGGAATTADGASFRVPALLGGLPSDGLAIRVRAMYLDNNGTLEIRYSAPTAPVAGVVAGPAAPGALPAEGPTSSEGVHLIRSDLQFILDQIKIAEAHAAGADLLSLPGMANERVPLGLRTVDGSFNNLVRGQEKFGAADQNFTLLLSQKFGNEADETPFLGVTNTDYAKLNAAGTATVSVVDSDPRTISNLIVDQTVNNPVAYQVAYDKGADGKFSYLAHAGQDGLFGTADDGLGADGVLGGGDDTDDVLNGGVAIVNGLKADGVTAFQTFEFSNVTTDEGLSAPFNSWFTLFGQFFDHGLDLVNKGGNGNVLIPLTPDDPLYVVGSPTNFMIMTRATNTLITAGADGIFGTADDRHFQNNQTTPFVDQNQTYTSHPSHQVFLREYVLVGGRPVATGNLLDGSHGGLPTWADVKNQARTILGIVLDDQDLLNLPLIVTDLYGKFIPAANGLAQIMTATGPQSGTLAAPIDATAAIRTNHAFLDDIAHAANPSGKTADSDTALGLANTPASSTATNYDNELLDRHFITGDGRGNENIGLTTVHTIFHAEHNRLVAHTKDVILASNDPAFIAQWLVPGANQADGIQANEWNGERLFQAARFGTEMQYQHLVFEEFARKVQPMVDAFFAPTQVYDTALNPAIVAEFAHVVYRFGHSMLNETVDRFDINFNVIGANGSTAADAEQIGLIQAFLNPIEFVASGVDAHAASGAIVRGMTRQVGNEIDEFVTEALRNNLVGLPLDLAAINIARGRDTGVPSLNQARAEFYAMTGDPQLKPYTSWIDFAANLKHEASVINFIAAYGTHASVTSAMTMAGKRAAATLLVLGDFDLDGDGVIEANEIAPADRLAFLNSPAATSGVNAIDFWVGGLAEKQMPFGGLLGSSFNFVFETQMERLQDGDRFYYLERTAGLNFLTELEGNSFAKLIMANTDAKHLPGDVFSTPTWTLEVNQSAQFTGLGANGSDDPTNGDPLVPLVIRDNPATVGPDGNYLQYTGVDHVVLGGTDGNDILIASIGDDTVWGDGGNDRIEGGHGNDILNGGAGDDIITDMGGDDNIKGGDGNDAIHGGNGINLIIGGFGKDFIVGGEDASDLFGGEGDDFILGSKANISVLGDGGNDWIEVPGNAALAPGDNFDPQGRDPVIGHDVFFGSSGTENMDGEGGDDIMMGNGGTLDHYLGQSGFDWANYQHSAGGVVISVDLITENEAAAVGVNPSIMDRFQSVEGIAGSAFGDIIYGSNMLTAGFATSGFTGSILTNFGLVNGLSALFAPGTTSFAGEIILGGGGSDIIRGGWGNEVVDGDKYLNIRLAGLDTNGAAFSYDRMDGELVRRVFAGEINPGAINVVREILTAAGSSFDTAVFSGDLRDYAISVNGVLQDNAALAAGQVAINATDVVTVDHGGGTDGIDTLRGIERLQFTDQAIVLDGTNDAPVGLLTVNDTSPTEGQILTVSALGITDADNVSAANPTGAITGPITYYWQREATTGTWVDILVDNGVTLETASGTTFQPGINEVGLSLRVRAIYQDANGVLEQAFSAPTDPVINVNNAPVGTVLVSDISPTETQALVAVIAFTDADVFNALIGAGAPPPTVYNYQWQQSAVGGGAVFTNIAGATAQNFLPTQAQVNRFLRVVVTYTDPLGTNETVISAPTIFTGDFIAANAAAQTLTGTNGQDIINGGDGADVINALGEDDIIDGGNQNDTINAGAGNDRINYLMGQGADTVNGGTEIDTLAITGTAGNNSLAVLFNGTAITSVEAGAVSNVEIITADLLAGTDTLSYANSTGAVTVNLATGTASGFTSIAGVEDVLGGNNNDTLIGDALANVLNGAAGNDTITGGLGNDTLLGGTNDDTFNYAIGDGADAIDGGLGTLDTLNVAGTAGADTLTVAFTGGLITAGLVAGGTVANVERVNLDLAGGSDTLSYGATTAAVTVNLATGTASGFTSIANIENVIGGAGADNLTGSAIGNVIDGAGGADTITGGLAADTLLGGAGADTFNYAVGDGADSINGGTENDTLNVTGTGGDDTLNVVFTGGLLTSIVTGGTLTSVEAVTANLGLGSDTLSYAGGAQAVTVNLATGAASGFTSVSNIENVVGSSAGDALIGSVIGNVFTGRGGNDALTGGAGVDYAVFSGTFAQYAISNVGGVFTVADSVAGRDGTDTLITMDWLRFTDQDVFIGNTPPTGAVTIVGTPAEDQILTATNNLADVNGLGTFSYQWQQSPVGGGAFTDIAGATSVSLTLGQAQVGRQIQVLVTYTDGFGNPEAVFSAPTAAVLNVNDAPLGAVSINDNTPAEDQLLTAVSTLTDEDGLGVITYQWQQSEVGGAGLFTTIGTGATFTSGQAQVGRALRVVATYTDQQGTTETVTSAVTATVTNVNDAPVGTVTINDTTPEVAQVLTAANNLTDEDGLGVITYQWQQSALGGGTVFTNIAGATGATLTVGADQLNRNLRVVASYTDAFGTLETVPSAATALTAPVGGVGVVFVGDGAANTFNGTPGADLITGNGGNDILNGNGGDDTFFYNMGNGADTVNGGAGIDTFAIAGGGGNDTLDVVFNGTSITSVEGGAVSNVEIFTVNLDGGADRLSYGAATTAAVNVNLTTGIASGGFTSLVGVDNVTGGAGNDTLVGNELNNNMIGNGGNNTFTGMAGNDTMTGGVGQDVFIATVGDGNDTNTGAGGNDTYDLSLTTAGATVTANSSTSAQTGTDALASIEIYIGSQGNDTITGDGTNEIFNGQAGTDTLNGNGGNDTFVFTAGFGSDTIVGFDASGGSIANQDMLDVRLLGITAANFAANVVIADLGADSLVTIGANTILLPGVNGVEPNAITQADFILA
jgi:Ca2+-binding RTX toxin-like protein